MFIRILIFLGLICTNSQIIGQEICNDGIDNDNDGYSDCFDSECLCYTPFDCNSNSFYQTVGVNGETILFETNIESYTLEPLYSLSDSGIRNGINAIGINPIDQFMYGISAEGASSPSQLIRIDASGRVEVVGIIDRFFGNFSAGTFGPDGTYYVCGSNKPLYKIIVDPNDPDFLQSELLGAQDPPYYEMADIAYSPFDQYIYGIESRSLGIHPNRTLYKVNPQTGFAEAIGNTSIPGGGYLGAFYFTPSGDAIVYSNDFGTMYVVDVRNNPPTGIQVGSGGPTTRSNDGASNPFCLGIEKSGPSSIVKGDTINYTITLYNTSGDTIYDVWLRDSLIQGLKVSSNLMNVTEGLSLQNTFFSGLRSIDLFIEKIPSGTFSFEFKVFIPCDHPSPVYSNQAFIEGYSQNLILSDDPNSPELQDSTQTELLDVIFEEVEVDTSVCQNKEFFFQGLSFPEAGMYQIFSENCDTVFNLTLETYPTDTIFSTIYICEGDSFNFNGRWLSLEGVYEHTYTDSNECQQYENLELFILSGATRIKDSLICQGDQIVWQGQTINSEGSYKDTFNLSDCFEIFQLNVSFRDYYISNREALICPGDSIYFSNEFRFQEGLYRDTISTNQGCDTIILLNLDIIDTPGLPKLNTICDPPAHELTFENLNNWTVFWDNGETTAKTSYSNEAIARYQLRIGNPGCNISGQVDLPPLPNLDFSNILNDSTLVSGSVLDLDLNINPNEWTLMWSIPDNFGCSNCPSVSYTANEDFQLSLEAVHRTGCTYRFSANYIVLEPLNVFIPNIFTPNGDGINDVWTIFPSDRNNFNLIEASIFDRWGSLIKEWHTSEQVSWDGTFKGDNCEEGVYTYFIKYGTAHIESMTSYGSLTLVR